MITIKWIESYNSYLCQIELENCWVKAKSKIYIQGHEDLIANQVLGNLNTRNLPDLPPKEL